MRSSRPRNSRITRTQGSSLRRAFRPPSVLRAFFRNTAISVSLQPELTAHRGKLLSGSPHRGSAVYAASFIRRRKIVLSSELLKETPRLRLLLVHELFHFVWPRLSNDLRRQYAELLLEEVELGARGELGESAAVKKQFWSKSVASWKDYVCESFCDTAAWSCSGVRRHESFTLAKRWRTRRAVWFHDTFERYWRRRCT